MLARFRRGPTSADLDLVAYTSVEEAEMDVWDGEEGDNAELIGIAEHYVDPELVKAHEAESS